MLQRIRIKGMAEGSIFKDRMDDLWRGVLVQPQGTLTTFIRMTSFINSNGDFARAMRDGEEGCSTCDIDPSSTVDHLVKHSYREDTSCCPYGPGGNKKGCETCSHLQAVLSQQLGQKHKSSMCPIGANFTRYHKTAKAWELALERGRTRRSTSRVKPPEKEVDSLFTFGNRPLTQSPNNDTPFPSSLGTTPPLI